MPKTFDLPRSFLAVSKSHKKAVKKITISHAHTLLSTLMRIAHKHTLPRPSKQPNSLKTMPTSFFKTFTITQKQSQAKHPTPSKAPTFLSQHLTLISCALNI
jgi:hypothetical protein